MYCCVHSSDTASSIASFEAADTVRHAPETLYKDPENSLKIFFKNVRSLQNVIKHAIYSVLHTGKKTRCFKFVAKHPIYSIANLLLGLEAESQNTARI